MRRTENHFWITIVLTILLCGHAFAMISAQQVTGQDTTVSYTWTNTGNPADGPVLPADPLEPTDGIKDLVAPTTEENQEELLNYDIIVFPNPNAGKFRLELTGLFEETVEFRIINVTGNKVYSRELNQQGEFFMDLTSLRKGIYFAQIKLGNKILSHPIVYAYDE